MKKQILRLLLFVTLLTIITCLLQLGLDCLYRSRITNKFTKILNHEVDKEVVFFGSSVVFHQFDPAIIEKKCGYTVYNAGFDGTFFIQYNCLVREYLSYTQKCKYIVIGCDLEELNKKTWITRPDLYMAFLDNKFVYYSLKEIEPRKIFLARFCPGYKFTMLSRSFYSDLLRGQRNNTLINMEYAPVGMKWKLKEKLADDTIDFDDASYSEFKTTIEQINGKGIKVIIVLPPVMAEWSRHMLNLDSIKSKYSALAKNDVYFLDYTKDTMCNNNDYFYNFNHVNIKGATVLSDKFAATLDSIRRN